MNKIDSVTHNENTIYIPFDVLMNICTRLDVFSLIQFEMASKRAATLLENVWAYKREKDSFAFEWSFLENDEQKNKRSYVLNLALKRYVLEDRQWIARALKGHAQEPADDVKKDLKNLTERFPVFGSYVDYDIRFLQRKLKVKKPVPLNKQNTPLFEGASQGKWGGDLLLAGLWEFTTLVASGRMGKKKHMQDFFHYCQKAIENKGTFISTLLIRASIDNYCVSVPRVRNARVDDSTIISEWFDKNTGQHVFPLAVKASEKKDHESLHVYMTYAEKFASWIRLKHFWQTCADYNHLLPIKASLLSDELGHQILALKKAELSAKEKEGLARVLFPHDSIRRFFESNEAVYQPEKWMALDDQYEKLLENYGEQAPAWVLREAALIKRQLGLWKEANCLYDQAIEIYQHEGKGMPLVKGSTYQIVGLLHWDFNIRVKEDQGKEIVCGHLAKGKIDLLEEAIVVKQKLELWNELDALYKKLLSTKWISSHDPNMELHIDAKHLLAAARLKTKFGQLEEADEIYTKYLGQIAYRAQGGDWQEAAFIKLNLKLWKAADHLYTRSLQTYGDKVPPVVLHRAACMKAELKDWQGADRLFAQLEACQQELTPKGLEKMAFVKVYVQDWQGAHRLFQRCIEAYGNEVPARIIEHAKYAESKCQEGRPALAFFG